jgi:hypothetical protein
MGVVTDLLAAVPVSVVVAVLLVRYLPDAVLTLLAGFVAVLSRDRERGRRAVEVLRVLRARTGRRGIPSARE